MKIIVIAVLLACSTVNAQSYEDFNFPNQSTVGYGTVLAPHAFLGGLTTYPDLVTFMDATTEVTFTVEDFTNNLIAPNNVCNASTEISSEFASGCFALNAVQPGFTITALGGGADTVLLTETFLSLPFDMVGAITFTDTTQIEFSPEVTDIAFDASMGFDGAEIAITAFDSLDGVIGTYVLPSVLTPNFDFAGFTSAVPISRLTIEGANDTGEVISNFFYGSVLDIIFADDFEPILN